MKAPSDAAASQVTQESLPFHPPKGKVVELFAGVGGFHLGLDSEGWEVVWANQFEPSTKKVQHAYAVYKARLDGPWLNDHSNVRIEDVPREAIPAHDLLVGGFPCQDYSVAKPLPQASGIRGKKGVLWWQIYELLHRFLPSMVLLENVDRLLNSPAMYRGRDFAIILACLDALGYSVEWRVVNAAEYGFPQRRRRVFIYGQRYAAFAPDNAWQRLCRTGVFARALPVLPLPEPSPKKQPTALRPTDSLPPVGADDFDTRLSQDWIFPITSHLGLSAKRSPFLSGGVMVDGKVWTGQVRPENTRAEEVARTRIDGVARTLGEVVRRTESVPLDYLVRAGQHDVWRKHKFAKSEPRNGYSYSEGSMCCPDDKDKPSRTIITGEGGRSPSRFKHIVRVEKGDLRWILAPTGAEDADRFLDENRALYADAETGEFWRRLVPEELEELNGFQRGWTDLSGNGHGMADSRRAFLMGNALVVGLVRVITDEMLRRWRER